MHWKSNCFWYQFIKISAISISDGKSINLLASFNFTLITRIKEHTIPYISQLINSFRPLTQNQQYIYSNYINQERANNTLNQNTRVPLAAFGQNHGQNQIPMPMIFTHQPNLKS